MNYVECEIDEIFEDSELRFFDIRRPENSLFWVKRKPRTYPSYVIYQEISLEGEKFLQPVKEMRDQVECIKLIARYMDNNPLGIHVVMDVINN